MATRRTWWALAGLDLSPRMAQRVAVPLDPPIRRVVWDGNDAIAVCCFLGVVVAAVSIYLSCHWE